MKLSQIDGSIRCLAYDSEFIAIGMARGKVRLIQSDLLQYDLISHTFDNHKNDVRDIKFYDGESNQKSKKLMISVSYDGSIVVVSLMEMQKVLKLNLNNVNHQIK